MTTSPATLASSTLASTTHASTTQSHSSAATSEESSDSGLSGGAIAGVVLGVIAFGSLLAALGFFLFRQRRKRQASQAPRSAVEYLGDDGISEESLNPVRAKTPVAEIYSPVRTELASDRSVIPELVDDRGAHAELAGETRGMAELDADVLSAYKRP